MTPRAVYLVVLGAIVIVCVAAVVTLVLADASSPASDVIGTIGAAAVGALAYSAPGRSQPPPPPRA